jgi:glycosyltransferase involved in cell wall biosynthesis
MSRPLRICMVTTFYPPFNFGGDGIFVRRLAGELVRRGHVVEVVHCTDAFRSLAPRGVRPRIEEDPGILVHRLKSPFGILSPLATQQTGYPLLKTRKLRAIFDRGFDVIHFHNVSLVGGPHVLELGNAVKLYTLHEFWLLCPSHILLKYKREVCIERDACVRCQLVHRRPPQLWRHTDALRRAARHVDTFLSPDRHTIGKHREWWPSMPIVHHPHFVPEVPLEPRDPQALPYFLFVGRLEKLKGLQNVIPLFREGPPAQLWIAGTGEYDRELRALAGGSPNIRFLGYQSGVDLQRLYRNALAVVAPSINFEVAPPLVVMEGFRQQTPALVPDLGSMPEIIADSGGGFVYRDRDDLASRLALLAAEPGLRDELGRRGYRAFREKWTAAIHLARYFDLIVDAAERRGRPSHVYDDVARSAKSAALTARTATTTS